jgi:uncharacterized protein (TIGR02265 family)
MPSGFRLPDWNEPLDTGERIIHTPEEGTLRGVFFQVVVDQLVAQGKSPLGPLHYSGFTRYPLRDYLRLVVAAARQLHPDLPLREALRRVGHDVYPVFKATMAGSAIFAFASDDFAKVAGLARKAYSVALSPAAVDIRTLGPRHIVVELRDVYTFPDCLQIGVWEGALIACKAEGSVLLQRHSISDADLEIEWR